MPELPEVETVKRGLSPILVGRRLSKVIARRTNLRWPLPSGFRQKLTNKVVLELERRGKFLVIRLDDGTVWISHLGMSGHFSIYDGKPPPEKAHDHIIIETDTGVTVRYNDPRRFGFMDLTTAQELSCYPMFVSMGPEPLEKNFTPAVLEERLKGRSMPIKTALLDQRIVAGIGNIYACEALHHAGISPKRLARSVRGQRARKLQAAIFDVLTRAIEAGGSSLRNHRQPDGKLGYFQQTFVVYGRKGSNCLRCGMGYKVRQIIQSGRSTFYCPNCQR